MASHDVAWDTFRHELRHWMDLRGMTNRELATRLRDAMREEADSIDELIVKRWRHSTSPPLGALRHIAEILVMSEDLEGNSEYDSSYLLRRMGLLAQEAPIDELFDTAYRLQQLRLRLMDVRSQLSDDTARNGAGKLVQVAVAQGYAAAVYPVWDGPDGYLMHVCDRLDFRPNSPSSPPAYSNTAIRAALTANFAVMGERQPRFSQSENDLAHQCHWAIPLIGRPFTRLGQAMHSGIPTIAVSSTTTFAWPDEIGAILAWLLGYGFTSTREVARELTPEPLATEAIRNDVHSQFLSNPPYRHVWSHHAVSLDPNCDSSPWAGPDKSLDSGILHVRLVESDQALMAAGGWLSMMLEQNEDDIVAEAEVSRDEVLRRREAEALEDYRDRMVVIDVQHYERSADRWEQALRCVLRATRAIAELGELPDLTSIHDRFLRDEPEIAPGILGWLADHECPIVNPKFSLQDRADGTGRPVSPSALSNAVLV